jgi:hypothetical protein
VTPSHHRVALAFLTKDRCELSERSIRSLLHLPIDLFWIDGSTTEEGKAFPFKIANEPGQEARIFVHPDVRGGPDAAVAYALTVMLKGEDYTHVGLCENDVLLHPDWFTPTIRLFDRGASDGLVIGAVSARCYADRILFQRDGYAVVLNHGWGMQILTREAASLTLDNMRTGMTQELRRTFCQLSGKDIGTYYAFKAFDHQTCADWQNDKLLASHGLASLALVPSPVEMIGQVPPLNEQGLKIADEPVEWLRDDPGFLLYAVRQLNIREKRSHLPRNDWLLHDQGGYTIFPHHVPKVGGVYEGDWRLKWVMGFGPFVWKAGEQGAPSLTVPLYGAVSFLVSGGEHGGKVNLVDTHSGYEITPELPPEGAEMKLLNLTVPGSVTYRTLKLTMLTPGTCFFGLRTTEPQPWLPGVKFDWHVLPRV